MCDPENTQKTFPKKEEKEMEIHGEAVQRAEVHPEKVKKSKSIKETDCESTKSSERFSFVVNLDYNKSLRNKKNAITFEN